MKDPALAMSSIECRSLYLQIESEKWGGQLIELMGDVPNGAIVHRCEESADCSKVNLTNNNYMGFYS